ncbi:MAG: C-type lectin domain-containing protein, partial [Faecalibacterium sp.]|nr:C-type lectin domain-containing protein [Ruminococcus sp.]MCM1486713.1 C-type lectin domain-containing protein [Faecalibacterium sp.]
MKNTKRIIALLLVVLTLFTCAPMSAFAVTQNNAGNVETETAYADDTGMGKILNNLIDEKTENDKGYIISDLTVEDKTATVKMNVLADCNLVVAVYDEDDLQMLGTGIKQVEFDENEEETVIDVDIEIDTMPRRFLVKAFLLDENNHALCEEFTCNTYTTMYQEFLNTTPDDFENKEIISMDATQDDFGVLNDDVVASAYDSKMTYTYDADTSTYVFKNAIDEIKKLKTGDVFYYVLSEELGDFLLFKVKSIKVDSSTVTIVEDEDISLADAFQFLRIDEGADFSDVEIDEDELGSALEIDKTTQAKKSVKRKAEVDKNESKSFSTSLKVSWPKKESDDKEAWKMNWKISGSIGYTLEASIRLYYDVRWGKDFYEFKTELKHRVDFKISVSGKTPDLKDKFNIPIGGKSGIPIGIFNLYIKVYPVAELSGSIDMFSFTVFSTNTVSITDSDGLKKDNTVTKAFSDPQIGKTKITIKVGIGVEAEFGWKKGKEDSDGLSKLVASISLDVKAYLKAELKPSLIGVLTDKLHECTFCLDGELGGVVEGTVSAKLKIISKKLSWSWDAISLSKNWNIGEMYISIGSNGFKIGMGNCPNIYHKVTAVVKNTNSEPIKDATVSSETGRCDADGSEKYKDKSMKTDKDGKADLYFNKGEHEVKVEALSYMGRSLEFKIIENEKDIEFKLRKLPKEAEDAFEYNGHYYKVYDEAMTWSEAVAYCDNIDGHLITITSREEQNFVYSIIKNMTKGTYWLGATDYDHEGEWTWVTNEKFSYSNWDAGEPNNGNGGIEHYAEMYRSRGTWNDGEHDGDYGVCSLSNHGLICEWDYVNFDSKSTKSISKKPSKAFNISLNNSESSVIKVEYFENAVPGEEYVFLAVKDKTAENLLAVDNLMYIDQKTAESNTVEFTYIPKDVTAECEVLIIGKCNHDYDSEVTEKATCTQEGTMTYTCSLCGDTYTEVIAKSEHAYETVTEKATCTKEGKTYQQCKVCGNKTGEKQLAKLAHTYDNGKITKAATCKETGVKTYTCKNCNATKTETIAKTTKHTLKTTTTKATTAKAGKTETKCTVCGTVTKTVAIAKVS